MPFPTPSDVGCHKKRPKEKLEKNLLDISKEVREHLAAVFQTPSAYKRPFGLSSYLKVSQTQEARAEKFPSSQRAAKLQRELKESGWETAINFWPGYLELSSTDWISAQITIRLTPM